MMLKADNLELANRLYGKLEYLNSMLNTCKKLDQFEVYLGNRSGDYVAFGNDTVQFSEIRDICIAEIKNKIAALTEELQNLGVEL